MKETAKTREAIYAFIYDRLKINMSVDYKDELKKLLVANANAHSEDLLLEISDLKKIIANRPKKKIFIRPKQES